MMVCSDDESECFSDKQSNRKKWIEKQNLQIRNLPHKHMSRSCTPDVRNLTPEQIGGSCRDLLRVSCGLSLSSLTGLSATSGVVRPCRAIKNASIGVSSKRTGRSPSTLLLHGYDWVSAEDQRILTMMVARREAQMEEQEVLISARKLWENDRILYNQMVNEKRKQWNELVQERRKLDKMELERRREAADISFSQHISELERNINERHKRCEARHQQIVLRKRHPRGDTDADTELHRLRRQQQLLQAYARSAEHIDQVRAKESRADHNLSVIIGCRQRNLRIRRKERDERMEAAAQLRAALASRLDEWCQQSMDLLSSRMCQSECRHDQAVQWRRKVARDTNLAKSLHHAQAITMLNEEERLKEQQRREELQKKDLRIRSVEMLRQNNIAVSRQHAHATSALRHQIKAAYPLIP